MRILKFIKFILTDVFWGTWKGIGKEVWEAFGEKEFNKTWGVKKCEYENCPHEDNEHRVLKTKFNPDYQ